MPLINLTQSYSAQWQATKQRVRREALVVGVVMVVIASIVFFMRHRSQLHVTPSLHQLDQQEFVVIATPEHQQPPLAEWIHQIADEPELARTLSQFKFQDAQLKLTFSASTNQLVSLLNGFNIKSWQASGYEFELNAAGEPLSRMVFQWQPDDAN
ncbi:MAG: hypothetical protein LAT77_02030 [Aliidiomarina sp.]|uniref:hypothetical protein n=1 Tax=Aliidiomarina sp. TaxID=1872439 RepID=UPI0025C438BA|nr:hypothetical protein [Aliidiomarina sp.]MCH8500670.1 hypothetical protein [Aliidiomarina sp.]